MNTLRNKKVMGIFLFLSMLMVPAWVMASTEACTQITNQATLSYSVGGIGQTDKVSNDGSCTTGNNCAFNVGVKVMVTVATEDTDEVSVSPGSTPAVLEFTVTNDGNSIHDYALAWEAGGGTATSPFAPNPADTFDAGAGKIAVYVESGANAGYQAAEDTAVSIDNLAGDGISKTVYIVYNPDTLSQSNGAVAVYYLKATSQWADGSAIGSVGDQSLTDAQTGGTQCGGGTTVAVVFKKSGEDGPAAGDGTEDAVHSAADAYQVSSATIGVTKTYSVVWDPINYNSTPKPIPGAIVEYTITINNSGSQAATLSTITDTLQVANLTLVTAYKDQNLGTDTPTSSTGEAFVVSCTAACDVRACESGGYTFTSAGDADGIDFATPTITATMGGVGSVVLPTEGACTAGSLGATDSVTVKFQATVN